MHIYLVWFSKCLAHRSDDLPSLPSGIQNVIFLHFLFKYFVLHLEEINILFPYKHWPIKHKLIATYILYIWVLKTKKHEETSEVLIRFVVELVVLFTIYNINFLVLTIIMAI